MSRKKSWTLYYTYDSYVLILSQIISYDLIGDDQLLFSLVGFYLIFGREEQKIFRSDFCVWERHDISDGRQNKEITRRQRHDENEKHPFSHGICFHSWWFPVAIRMFFPEFLWLDAFGFPFLSFASLILIVVWLLQSSSIFLQHNNRNHLFSFS